MRPSKLLSAAAWRARFLFGDRRFALRERLAYVHPLGRQLTEGELVTRALRRPPGEAPYYALGGLQIQYEPDGPVGDPAAYQDCVELLLREAFLAPDLFDGEVQARPGDVLLDLGASIGTCAMDFARRVGPAGRVHAFEPLVPDVLQRNLDRNGFSNVDVVPCAASDEPGTATLHFNDDYVSASIARVPGEAAERPARGREVEVTTVDAYVEARGLQRVDLLKLDVEGAEELALRGAARTLERFRPRLTIASYHSDHEGDAQHPKLVRWLRARGYRTREVEQRRIYAW